MSDTPRTDKLVNSLDGPSGRHLPWGDTMAYLARELERELTAERAARQALEVAWQQMREERQAFSDEAVAERAARQAAEQDAEAVRELMNVYNLGGWTDALAPMKRALEAERALAEAHERLTRTQETLGRFCRDVGDDMECLPTCDSEAHDAACPVANPQVAWRTLRERVAAAESALAELKAGRKCLQAQGEGVYCDEARIARSALAEARRDAERYHWLKGRCVDGFAITANNEQMRTIFGALGGHSFDAAIDAALAGRGERDAG